jgi:hypothetical protein
VTDFRRIFDRISATQDLHCSRCNKLDQSYALDVSGHRRFIPLGADLDRTRGLFSDLPLNLSLSVLL